MCSHVLVHVYKHEQVYITRTHTRWEQVQKYTAKVHSQKAVLFLCADEQTWEQRESTTGTKSLYLNCVCVTFYWNRKSKEVNSTKKKRERASGLWLSSERSLGADGELLQVMDALLVNQTDSEGGEVQDEALVQLQKGARTQEEMLGIIQEILKIWDYQKYPDEKNEL